MDRGLGFGLFSILLVACGGSDDKPAANPDCGTVQAPTQLETKNVSPSPGSSVPNASIVQTFTIVGRHLQISPSFQLPASHTAGKTIPTPSQWTISVSGPDTVYTSEPLTWEKAPAHVEIDASGLMATSDGCVFLLPSPLFEYDITEP
ncbi:MAG TPA: hypothetical protein VFK05_34075 [Polyangiaceae bacterium]|nr:hypothetical protein [Polyangiaceae bacterium]